MDSTWWLNATDEVTGRLFLDIKFYELTDNQWQHDSFMQHRYHLQVSAINLVLPVTVDDNTLVLCSSRKPGNGCHKLVYLAHLLIFNGLNDTRHFYATRGNQRMGRCRKFNTISHNLESTSGLSLLSLDMFYVGVEKSRGEVGFRGFVLCQGNGGGLISPSHGTVNNISYTTIIEVNCCLTHFARISSFPQQPWQRNGIQEGRKAKVVWKESEKNTITCKSRSGEEYNGE